MSEYYYAEALKLGQKEARACEARGLSPHLPALEDLLPPEQTAAGVDLGLCQIPAEFVAGTRTAARSAAFARNFMPLLEPDTEFAAKWQRLCRSHVAEGIREPVKVWEYRNRYYVEEGNKRVSVLKFFASPTVSAQVRRILPEHTDDEATECYFELIEFQRISRIRCVEFSRRGSCAELQKLTGKAPAEPWTDNERSGFHAMFACFRSAYDALGGGKLTVTPGDALLACARIHGYQALCSNSLSEMKTLLTQAWEDILLLQQRRPVELKLEPAQEKKPSLLSMVLPGAKTLKAAFLHDKTPDLSGWTKGHEEGRAYVDRVLGDRVSTAAYFNALDDPEQTLRAAIADGNTVLFTTSPRLLPAALRVAAEHPEITVFNCALNQAHRYIRSYHARMYEAKFIIGAMAGVLAGHSDVGYIADYPIYGQIAGINAFAFGVGMVNPRARVHLEWSGTDSVEAAQARLAQKGIVLISSQDQTNLRDNGRSSFGLSVVSGDTKTLLAMPVWEWGIYYELILRRALDNTLRGEYTGSDRALNYFWGMRQGVVSLRCADTLPEGVRRLERILCKSVCAGLCDPFRGALFDQNGREMVAAHDSLSPEQIIGMDWLAENVSGAIPPYESLTERAKATVDMIGVLHEETGR